jgi:hypothetical protein
MKNDDSFTQYLFTGAVYALLLFYYLISWGLVLCLFWLWFITPTFGLDTITYYQAIGLITIASIFTRQPLNHMLFLFKKPKNKTNIDNIKIYMMFMSPWLMLVAGYVVLNLFSKIFD